MIKILKVITTINKKRVKAGSCVDFKFKVFESEKSIIFKLSHFRFVDKKRVLIPRNKNFSKRFTLKFSEEDWLNIKKPIDNEVATEILLLHLESKLGKEKVIIQ